MPTLPHLILGGIFGICLYYISDKKFTKMHVFILFINNLLGPDLGWVLGLGTISHSIIGAIFYALLLTFIYHYITKFTIEINGINDIEIIELEKHQLSYSQTYYLVLAGCIMHDYLDFMLNSGGIFIITPSIGESKGLILSIQDLIGISLNGVVNIELTISFLIAMVLYLGFVISFVYFLKKNTYKEALILILHITIFFMIFYLFGHYKTTFHSDNGAIIYITIFWLFPIILCTLSVKNPRMIKKSRKFPQLVKINKAKLYQTLLLFLAIITMMEGIAFLIIKDDIIKKVMESEIIPVEYYNDFSTGLFYTSIALILVGCIEFCCWVYLWRKPYEEKNKNIIWTSFLLFFLGGVILAAAIMGLSIQALIFDYVYGRYGSWMANYISKRELINFIFNAGIFLLSLAIIELSIAIILLFRKKIFWKCAVYFHLMISWTIIGLLIACYLSENSVKNYLSGY